MKVILFTMLFVTILTTSSAQQKKVTLLSKKLNTTTATTKNTTNYFFLQNVDLVRNKKITDAITNTKANYFLLENIMPIKKDFGNAVAIPNACTKLTKINAVPIPNVFSTPILLNQKEKPKPYNIFKFINYSCWGRNINEL